LAVGSKLNATIKVFWGIRAFGFREIFLKSDNLNKERIPADGLD
jgi:hypothetical protein